MVGKFIGFDLFVESKEVCSLMPALGFRTLFDYPNRCDGISSCRWASSEFPKCPQTNHCSCYKYKLQFSI